MNDKRRMPYTDKAAPRIEIVFDWRKNAERDATGKTAGSVDVRIYERGGKRTYISTGVKVLPREWNEKLRMVYKRDDAETLNSMIREQYDNAVAGVKSSIEKSGSLEEPVIEAKALKVDRSDSSFLDWVESYIQAEVRAGRLNKTTSARHRVTLRDLEAYGKIRKFCDVTPEKLRAYLDTVREKTVSKVVDGKVTQVRISQPTIYNYFKNVKCWVRAAIDKRKLAPSCMAGVKESHGDSAVREHLNWDELMTLSESKFSTPHLCNARDRFLIQAGTGLSFCDIENVEWERIETIDGFHCYNGRRGKTKKQFFFVMLDFAWEALQRMGGKVPKISVQKYNEYLGVVMSSVGIDKHITSHCGRHTYAYICLVNEVPMASLQRALGHTNIRTTQIYGQMVNKDIINHFKKKFRKMKKLLIFSACILLAGCAHNSTTKSGAPTLPGFKKDAPAVNRGR